MEILLRFIELKEWLWIWIYDFFFEILSSCSVVQLFGFKASKMLRDEGSRVWMPLDGTMVHASTAVAQKTALEWVKKDKRRMLHVVYRVGDLDRSVKYTIELTSMTLKLDFGVAVENMVTTYKFEPIERGSPPELLCQVMLHVGDIDRSIIFYEKAFGMELLRTQDNPQYKVSNYSWFHMANKTS
ncbi:hypothetical protein PTKIN_Ptkin04bG0219400 [Pterospermum kingtungense]